MSDRQRHNLLDFEKSCLLGFCHANRSIVRNSSHHYTSLPALKKSSPSGMFIGRGECLFDVQSITTSSDCGLPGSSQGGNEYPDSEYDITPGTLSQAPARSHAYGGGVDTKMGTTTWHLGSQLPKYGSEFCHSDTPLRQDCGNLQVKVTGDRISRYISSYLAINMEKLDYTRTMLVVSNSTDT